MVLKCIVLFVTFGVVCTKFSDSYAFNEIDKMDPDNESVTNELLATTEDTMTEIQRGNSSRPYSKNLRRSKRSVFNLISMIQCATGCSVVRLSDYGNYCGWGGSGTTLNDIDRCCMYHDKCYTWVQDNYGLWSSYSTYYRSYKWYCNGGEPTCGKLQPPWKTDLCNCDLYLTNCLRNYGCP